MIEPPGASDGACGGGAPDAGSWFQSYALGLASRSLTP
jgi:endoglucanase